MKTFKIKTILVFSLLFMSSVPILSFGLLEAIRWEDYTERVNSRRSLKQLRLLHQEVQRALEIRLSSLELMAEQIRTMAASKQLGDVDFQSLLKLYVEKFQMNGAGICDLQGRTLQFYGRTPGSREYFRKVNLKEVGLVDPVLETKASFVSPIRKSPLTGRHLFSIMMPIWDEQHQNIQAIIGSAVTAEEIQRIAEQTMATDPNLQFLILDQKNQVIARSGPRPTTAEIETASTALFQPVTNGEPEVRVGENSDKLKVHATIQNLVVREGYAWRLVIWQDLSAFTGNTTQAWQRALVVTAGAWLFSFLMALLLSNLISKPILNLVEQMKLRKKVLDPSKSPGPPRNFLTLQEIQEAFDALTVMSEKIQMNTERLELQVEQRTRELLKTHQELDEQRARSVESARLASLGEMAGGIAHEINNPLSIISLITQQQQEHLRKFQFEPDRAKEAFHKIDVTTHRISKIIRGLKAFSRDGANDPVEPAVFQLILENTLNFCFQKFKYREVELRTDVPEGPIRIECRAVQISQVLLNLLNNAFDAVQTLPDKWVEIKVTDGPERVVVRVRDSGPGVPESIRSRIFEPFFTLKGVGQGTGLGLSISKGIVESHRGRISVDPNDRHTCFVLELPKHSIELDS